MESLFLFFLRIYFFLRLSSNLFFSSTFFGFSLATVNAAVFIYYQLGNKSTPDSITGRCSLVTTRDKPFFAL